MEIVREWRANASFGETSAKGRFCWLYALVMPYSCCGDTSPGAMLHPNPSWMLLVSIIVITVQLTVGILEFAQRSSLAADDKGRYGGAANWLMDISSLTWLCSLVHSVARFAYCLKVCGADPRAIKARDAGGMPWPAKLQRFAVTFYLPSAVVEITVYAVFAHGRHVHAVTTSFFAMTCTFALLELVIANTHLEIAHLVWVLLIGLIYAFPISLIHYVTQPRDAAFPYIQGALNWSRPVDTLIMIIELLLLTSGVYGTMCAWCGFKNRHAYAAVDEVEGGECDPMT